MGLHKCIVSKVCIGCHLMYSIITGGGNCCPVLTNASVSYLMESPCEPQTHLAKYLVSLTAFPLGTSSKFVEDIEDILIGPAIEAINIQLRPGISKDPVRL